VDKPSFFVLKPANGNPANVGNGVTVSFEAPNRAAVHAFHETALAAGGICEGQPGSRNWAENAYAAYARDLDGNKLAVYRNRLTPFTVKALQRAFTVYPLP
jgi:predicted lactoylglutathione lyase